MKCRKCKQDIPSESNFCLYCGTKQEIPPRTKKRGNGEGSAYQLPSGKWACEKTLEYCKDPEGTNKRKMLRKKGFRTKKEALAYLANMAPTEKARTVTFGQLYDMWLPTHRAGKSTLNCYRSARKYFEPISSMDILKITIDDLQACLDECPKGRRTQENMKAMCGLMYKYGIPRRITDINMAEYLKVSGDHGEKEGLPLDALEKIRQNIGKVTYADYVYCQCYLGFRPSELLALDISNYDPKEKAFTGGSKTDAGKDRIVTISPKIQPIIDKLIRNKNSGAVFSKSDGEPMRLDFYRDAFYQVLQECGIENPTETKNGITSHKYTPHSCRHTFATLLKNVSASDKDKLSLIGHTTTEMLRHYQDVNYADLRKITDAL